jgi:hypothetical protein
VRDSDIRNSFHKNVLYRHHAASHTLVLDELGLMHGNCRADIAVINGKLMGYEIKSDKDSLARLANQVPSYDAIFDQITIIVGERHRSAVSTSVPKHWGVILARKSRQGAIDFQTCRKAKANPYVSALSVAQLLWRNEAAEILQQLGAPSEMLRSPRAKLYQSLSERLPLEELKGIVRTYLKKRTNWRCQRQPSGCDDSCRSIAT